MGERFRGGPEVETEKEGRPIEKEFEWANLMMDIGLEDMPLTIDK